MDGYTVLGGARAVTAAALLIVITIAAGCAPDGARGSGDLTAGDGDTACLPTVTTLYANRTSDAGRVTIDGSDTELVVRVEATDGWRIELAHLYAGTGPVPTNGGGNVAPGLFPYAVSGDHSASMELRVPLADLGVACGAELVIALHADLARIVDVTRVERAGAWAYGDPFLGRQWGWSLSHTVCCAPPVVGCTLTQGYWKNHPDAWPVASLSLGGVVYPQSELIELLRTPVRGDASVALGYQLVAAELDVASGASASTEVLAALAAAHAWTAAHADADGRLPYGVGTSTDAGGDAVALAEILAAYAEGRTATPHCE